MAYGKSLELAKLRRTHPRITINPPAETRAHRRGDKELGKKALKIQGKMQAEMDNYMAYPRKVKGEPRRFVRAA